MKLLNYKNLAIIGAGGHTRSSLNLIKQIFYNASINIYDDNYEKSKKEFINDIQVVGKIKDIDSDKKIFLSLGDNNKRAALFEKYSYQIIRENLFHSTSFIEESLTIGIANQIYANTYVNSNVTIGNNNIINSTAVLEHEVIIGDHNHISVGAKICGRVKIGNNCFIGAGSTIIDNINICDNVLIGAGSVIINDIIEPGTYVGTPARKIP